MNSSISSSDTASEWARCLVAILGTLALGASLVFALMIAVDPYDSGRFGLFGIEGVDDRYPATANASRARDPQFDSAVIGNSTAQRLNPAELSQATGTHFVQLSAPGADPRGQLAILDFFIRHHQGIGALVIVIDPPWCTHELALLPRNVFPFWLYGASTLEYAGRLFSWRALDHAFQRIMIGLSLRKRSHPDGSFNYEEDFYPPELHPVIAPQQEPAPAFTGKVSDVFPAKVLLDGVIKKLPANLPIVLVVPPTFYTAVPRLGSIEAAEREACKAAFKPVVAGRPRSNFVDYRIDNALTRDPTNFVDHIHYRAKIARKMEEGIVASIRLGEAAKIDF
ncbi:MAG: hypothetical protein QOI87_1915 [Bradyrhizobium sp.]|nr:hypothetical protein [Bradyrhizobium sp.]